MVLGWFSPNTWLILKINALLLFFLDSDRSNFSRWIFSFSKLDFIPKFEVLGTISFENERIVLKKNSVALSLVEDVINPDSVDVRGEIMKLKLSLTTSTPVELSHQIDSILEKLSEAKNA